MTITNSTSFFFLLLFKFLFCFSCEFNIILIVIPTSNWISSLIRRKKRENLLLFSPVLWCIVIYSSRTSSYICFDYDKISTQVIKETNSIKNVFRKQIAALFKSVLEITQTVILLFINRRLFLHWTRLEPRYYTL